VARGGGFEAKNNDNNNKSGTKKVANIEAITATEKKATNAKLGVFPERKLVRLRPKTASGKNMGNVSIPKRQYCQIGSR